MADTFYLIDASGYIFRAYHALPPLRSKSGIPTGAVYGYSTMFLKLLQEKKPSFIAAAFDAARETFRTAEYADYKANRPDLPIDLAPQFPLIHEVTRAFQIPILIEKGFEADDLIATMATRAKNAGFSVVILSMDKDLMQLVDDKVSLLDPIRNKLYGPKEVEKKFGVPPEKIPDYLGLVGDSSDNLPGVPGVGPKTAADLLQTFGTLEKVLASVDKITGKKRKENLLKHADDARLSKKLAILRYDVSIPESLESFRFSGIDANTTKSFFHRLEFTRLAMQIAPESPIDRSTYQTILDWDSFDIFVQEIRNAGEYAVDLETTSIDPHTAEIVGISFSYADGKACYIPVTHHYLGVPKQLSREEVLKKLKPILEDSSLKLYGQHSKYERVVFSRYQINMAPVACDTMLASYILDANESHSLTAISQRHLGHDMITYEQVAGRGKKQIGFDEVDIKRATEYAAEDADVTYRLAKILPPKLKKEGLEKLLFTLEQPLSSLLAKVESNGVRVDVSYLQKMSNELGKDMAVLEKRSHKIAGSEFNVNSPKQLQEILFNRLELPVTKRTKTGPSTNSAVLEELDHPLAKAILEYRQLAKLKSTYLDTLPALVHPKTQRIHTSFNQAVAATGRLSSSEPNLQNIPIRTEVGRKIRKAFVAAPGNKIAALDYSQIELRLLAHFSEDPAFLSAYQAGEDIHRRTASELLEKPQSEVTNDERRISKTITFGIIYGMGAFRLKQELGISQSEAQDYIDRYFARYAKVRSFFDTLLENARKNFETRTILGRRRAFPDLMSPNHQIKANTERMAINSPIQGSAADVIKIAMLRVDEAMIAQKLQAKMILQVHDELLFEVPEEELDTLCTLAKREMEQVGKTLDLKVPLLVEVGTGDNWEEAH